MYSSDRVTIDTRDIRIEVLEPYKFGDAQSFYSSVGYLQHILPTDATVAAIKGAAIIGIVRHAFENGITVLKGMQIEKEYQRSGVGTKMLLQLETCIQSDYFCLPHGWLESFYG